MTQPLARRLARSAFRSLAARISFFVFAATLTSALAVATTSSRALRGFLRAKVEQKIPAAVTELRDRLDLWYAQRALDVEVFARSATVVDGLARLAQDGDRARAADRAEVEQYLGYVLQGLPEYVSIFVLDADGHRLLGVGKPPAFASEVLQRLATGSEVAISGVLTDREGSAFQAVTSPVRGRDERRLCTLHAILPLGALEQQLANGASAGVGRALVFDEQGAFVAASRPLPPAARAMSPSLRGIAPGDVRDYVAPDGVRVVGSALPFPRLHWTIAAEEEYDRAFAPIAEILGRTVALDGIIVLVLSAVAFGVVASLVRPLHALSDCARRLRDGEEGVEIPVVASGDEVGILARSFREMVDSLKRANETLEQLAITDGLTKIHNHRFFQDQLAKEIKRCERSGAPLALVMVDIDDFKALNDRHGHAVGDRVLEQLAALLVEHTRDHDLVARYGGEEFAILAPDTDRAAALALAEKLRLVVGETGLLVPPAAEPLAITVSVGVAVYHGDRQAFFHEADRALYAAKGSGKDCVVAAEGGAVG